ELACRTPVHIVLLDINLGSEQGGSFLYRARGMGFRGKVLVVTAGVSNREAAWLLKRGCSGIFLKREPLSSLVEKIRETVRGTAQMDAPSLRAILSQIKPMDQPRKP